MSVTGTVGNGKGRYAEWMAVRDQVLFGQGRLDSWIRKAAAAGRGVPADFSAYVEKVHARASEVEDGDIESLRHAGHTEDQIFELTVSAALGAGLRRLELALAVLEEE